MRKICLLVSAALVVLLSGIIAESASVGAPGIQPGRGRFIFALEYATVSSRDLFDEDFAPEVVGVDADHYIAKIKYGLSDRLTLFAMTGSSDLDVYVHSNSSGIGWGGGFDFILFEDLQTGLSLIGGAQYYTYEPEAEAGTSFDWQEWDASMKMLIVNYVADPRALVEPFALTHATFYGGLRYSDVRVDWTSRTRSGTLEAEDNLGYFAGVDFVFNDNYIFNIEARFNDESAYTAAIGFKF